MPTILCSHDGTPWSGSWGSIANEGSRGEQETRCRSGRSWGLGLNDGAPGSMKISRARRLIDVGTHRQVFNGFWSCWRPRGREGETDGHRRDDAGGSNMFI
jgi:hypothetical protein